MSSEKITGQNGPLRGEISPPGDKSISHRSLLIGSIAEGRTTVTGFLNCEDTLSSANAMRSLGIPIDIINDRVIIEGRGLRGLTGYDGVIDAGNSGTTARLLTGLLSPQSFDSQITGDKYLRARPMSRVVTPLSLMGARINGEENDNKLPLRIEGTPLRAITYELPVASAQVKSAILLAGLYAEGQTVVVEPSKSRDHTERMLSSMGDTLKVENNTITLETTDSLKAVDISVPGDISSAAFYIVGALINKNSELLIKNVGLNELRTGVLDVLKDMGADINTINTKTLNNEPVGDLLVKSSNLKATVIDGDTIPRAIDELPVIAVAACFAEGKTVIKDARELRVKETDRIEAISTELNKLGGEVEEFEDGMSITGTGELRGATCSSRGDHRIAMAMAVAATAAVGDTVIEGAEAVSVSYPNFFNDLKSLR